MQHSDRHGPASPNGNAPIRSLAAHERSLVSGWSVNRAFYVAIVLSLVIAAADAILGRHVILVGALIVGPCCALLTGRWARTAAVGAWAIALAVLLGLPDRNFGSWTHLVFIGAVVIVTVVATASAAIIESVRSPDRR